LGRAESGVVKFLRARAADRTTYVADDPIWGVTSGPWRLSSYDVKRVAPVVMVPSPSYDGPVKAPVAQLRLIPFSTMEGERAALQSGTVDVGYVSAADVQPPSAKYPNGRILSTALRARVVARYTPLWMSTFAVVNFDPATGSSPLLRQLYFRQALQSSMNQSALIAGPYGRLGYANWSAVPASPSSPALGTATNPYPYNVVRAKKYLTDNGWSVPIRGVATCARDTGCGSGVPKGASAAITYKYFNSGPLVSQRLALEQAAWAQIGIQVSLVPIDNIGRLVRECVSGSPGTAWQICELSPWAYFPDTYPSGEALFHSASPANIGSYRDSTMDAIVTATSLGSESLGTRYAAYSATQLPVLYQPNRGALVAWSKRLKAALGPSPTETFLPEFFHP
jgi:peptide/nickel transport system substrate-binding protein